MRYVNVTIGSLLALAVAGCSSDFAGSTSTGARPMGATSTASGAASKEPESANSLPPGDSISGPVTNRVGNVGATRY